MQYMSRELLCPVLYIYSRDEPGLEDWEKTFLLYYYILYIQSSGCDSIDRKLCSATLDPSMDLNVVRTVNSEKKEAIGIGYHANHSKSI